MASSFIDALDRLALAGPQREEAEQSRAAAQGVAQAQGGSNVQVSQQIAPALAQAQGQVQQQTTQQNQQQLAQLAQQGIQQQGFQQRQQLAERGLQQQAELGQQQRQAARTSQRREQAVTRDLTDKELKQSELLQQFGIDQDNQLLQLNLQTRKDLDQIGNDLQDKLIDSRRRFEKDEWGRKFQNERQLADFAIASAESELDLQLKLQGMQQSFQRSTQLLKAAHMKIIQELQQQSTRRMTAADQKIQEELAIQEANMRKSIARQEAKSAAIGNLIQGGMVAGAALLPVAAPVGLAIMGASVLAGAAASKGKI